MKKLLLSVISFLFTFLALAQGGTETAIRFLDIPVDGSASTFAIRLAGKGFSPVKDMNGNYKFWRGEFNGEDVKLYFDSFRGKVYIVLVEFPGKTYKAVKEDYNRMLLSLKDNSKYLPIDLYNVIPEDEDIRSSFRKGNKYMARFAYMSPDYFSHEEAKMLQYFGNKVMSMEPEEQDGFLKALETMLSASLPENATPAEIDNILRKLESLAYGKLGLSLDKKGFLYHVMLLYLNEKNAPSNDGRDL